MENFLEIMSIMLPRRLNWEEFHVSKNCKMVYMNYTNTMSELFSVYDNFSALTMLEKFTDVIFLQFLYYTSLILNYSVVCRLAELIRPVLSREILHCSRSPAGISTAKLS